MVSLTQKVRRIDDHFGDAGYYPHVPFEPFAATLVDVALNGTGERHLWVSTACALVEVESGGKNLFGCDSGAWFCHRAVTPVRVTALIKGWKAGDTNLNGIGLTQLTWFPYVQQARMLGGAHIPRNQMIVGFNVLNDLLNRYPYATALEAYNDGKPEWNDPANPYDEKFARLNDEWKERLSA